MKLGRIVWRSLEAASVLLPLAALLNYFWWKSGDQALLNMVSWIPLLSMHLLVRFGVKRRLLSREESRTHPQASQLADAHRVD